MKSLLACSLILISLNSEANVCKSGDPLLQAWRNQKNWIPAQVSTSHGSGNLTYDVVVTDKEDVLLRPFEKNSDYKTEMSLEVNSHYTKERFVRICKNNLRKGRKLSRARVKGSTNQFRLPVQLFPESGDVAGFDLLKQNLELSSLGVRLVFREDSMVQANLPFLGKLSDTAQVLTEIISSDLAQRKASFVKTGELEVRLDGMDDLACDVMRGRVEIELYAFGNMKEPQVSQITKVEPQSVKVFYEGLKSYLAETKLQSPLEIAFAAGRIFENGKVSGLVDLPEGTSVFAMTGDLMGPNFNSIRALSGRQLDCLAENYSTYQQETMESSVILNIQSQQIHEIQEAQ